MNSKHLFLLLFAAALGWYLPTRVMVTTSASLEARVFWMSTAPKAADQVHLGEYLSYRHTHPWMDKEPQTLMTKRVGCMPGQSLEVRGSRRFYCQGRYLGEAQPTDSEDRRLPQFGFSGTVPPGKFFMCSSHPRSWDSKYYGFVDFNQFLYKALPLF